jgi:hypothetical protein
MIVAIGNVVITAVILTPEHANKKRKPKLMHTTTVIEISLST